MLHTKFSGHRFDMFLPYRGVAAILVMLPASCHQIFISLYQNESFHTKFGSDRHSSF